MTAAMQIATIEDIGDRWRPLTSEAERTRVWLLITAAWRKLQAYSPGVEARVLAGSVNEDVVRDVVCDAVIRVLQNPDGRKSGTTTIDDYTESWTLSDDRAAGLLYFTGDELSLMLAPRVRRGSFTVTPA